ncbi:hypothetical protein HanIR_Chr12g0561531 [Helianthus annuus]|nr:hypothetical protein HanIR_Chr12g0561531 [Helianthus annuus]
MPHSMSEISEAFQNLNLYPVNIEVSQEFTGYFADVDQPVEFHAPPLTKPKRKKKKNYVWGIRIHRKKPVPKLPKINNPLEKGKEIVIKESSKQQEMETEVRKDSRQMEIQFEEYSKEIEMEVGQDSRPTQVEIGESSNQNQGITFQDEIDFLLANCETIQPVNTNVFTYPSENPLPMNFAPAIPEPIVHAQPIEMEEWWTNDWQFQNIVNYPYSFLPQFDPEPLPNPPMSTENMAELRYFGEELMDAGNRIREIGGQIAWKYDEREG